MLLGSEVEGSKQTALVLSHLRMVKNETAHVTYDSRFVELIDR